jgi:hypothetical protein
MRPTLKLFLSISFCIFFSCKDHNNVTPEFFTLSTKITAGQIPSGFSFGDLKVISFPLLNSAKPDFLLSVHTDEFGNILGPMLSHPDLENRFNFVKKFDDLNSAQICFDTIATTNITQYQTFAFDINPFEIWLVKTNTGKTGKLLILETRTDNINNAPFAEIRFKPGTIDP